MIRLKPLRCSCCKSPLFINGQARLETLVEHVSDPNGPVSLKDQFACSNESCATRAANVVWNEDGEVYVRGDYALFREIPFRLGEPAAIGSWWRRYNLKVKLEDRTTFRIPTPWLRIDVRLFRPDVILWARDRSQDDIVTYRWHGSFRTAAANVRLALYNRRHGYSAF